MMDDWDSLQRWRRQVERRLNEACSLVNGNNKTQADRIADVIEQIDELRRELAAMNERLDKAAEYVKANVPKREGGEEK